MEGKKGQIISFPWLSAAIFLLVPVPLASCYELLVTLHDTFWFKETDLDDLEEGKISTIFLNEMGSDIKSLYLLR